MHFKTCRRCDEAKDITEFHQHPRMADGHLNICRLCRSRQDADYREKNRESLKAKAADRRARTRDQIKVRDAAYRARTLEQRRAYDREYYKKNRERLLAYQENYRAQNGEYIKEREDSYRANNRDRLREWHRQYRADNPDLLAWRARVKEAVRRAQKRSGCIVRFTEDELKAKFAYWNDCCWICGDVATSVDHVKPLSAGGAHMLCNLRPACGSCNSVKKDRWPLVSRAELLGFV